jgi:hypothetical protein
LISDRHTEPDVLAFMSFPTSHRAKLHSTDEMDKRFFDRDDDCGNRCTSILLFGRAAGYSSVPAINLAAAARRGGQGWPHLRPPQGLALTGPSTVARCMERDWPGWKLPSAAIMVIGRGRPRGEA